MRRIIGLSMLLAFCADGVWAADPVLQTRPGAWEMTSTSTATGSMIPPGTLANMSPEQRARIEAMMQSRNGQPRTHVSKSCVTQEDLNRHRLMEPEGQEGCTSRVLSRSRTRMEFERSCTQPMPSSFHIVAEAPSPEQMRITMDSTHPDRGRAMHMEITGRWLGPSCEGIPTRPH